MHRPAKSIHPFPAKMAPDLALRHLLTHKKLRVLDPMVGSGTVVRIARDLGHKAIGFDTDPLALIIAEAWCNPPRQVDFRSAVDDVLEKVANWQSIPADRAYPKDANEETKKFIRYWFDLRARRQLAALVSEVSRIKNRRLRLLMMTAVSKTIIVKDNGVSLARDVSHSRPHKSYDRGPRQPIEAFIRAAEQLEGLLSNNRKVAGAGAKILRGDARKLPIPKRSIDLVVTSPPYLNAIDYLRGHKLSLVWFGYQTNQIRKLRSTNIGAEAGSANANSVIQRIVDSILKKSTLSTRKKQIFYRYATDIAALMREIARVLHPAGKCVIVVGDCNIDGIFVRNSQLLKLTADLAGFRLKQEYRRKIPDSRRYLPPPRSQHKKQHLAKRMRTEVVLVFSQRATSTRATNTRMNAKGCA